MRIERYADAATLHAAVPALGQSWQRRARAGLEPHRHACHELCVIDEGAVDWRIGNDAVHLPAGYACLTQPGELHQSATQAIQPCRLTWIQCDLRRLGDAELAAQLGPGRHCWPACSELRPLMEGILAECRAPTRDSGAIIDARLRLLLRLAARDRGVGSVAELPAPLRRALEAAAHEDCPTLALLLRASGIGRSRLHTLFRAHLGSAPSTWLARQRLDRARQRLLAGARVTDVALALGYASSQHLARAVRRVYGTTPTRLRG